MKKNIAMFMILSLVIMSCNNQKQKNETADLTIDIKKLEEVVISPNIVLRNSTYVQLETNDSSLIGNNIEKLAVMDNKIFILDSNKRIFVFSKDGTFLNKIGNIGAGPNEQLSIVSFYLHPVKKYIGVFDVLKQTVFKFSFDGTLLDKIKFDKSIPEFYDVNLLLKDNMLIMNTYNEPRNKHQYLLVNEKELKLEKLFFPYLATGNVSMKYGFPRIAIMQDTCFILTQYSDNVKKYHNKDFVPYLQINSHLKSINNDTKFSSTNETGSVLDYDNNLINNKYSLGIEQIYATNEYLYLLYQNYQEKKTYHIIRNLSENKNYLITLDEEFYKYPMADIVSFGNFKSSTTEHLITTFILRDGFMDVDGEVINNNESLKKIRKEFDEEGNPIIAFIDIKKIIKDAKK